MGKTNRHGEAGGKDKRGGKDAPRHEWHPELGTPNQCSRDERVTLNLLWNKDIVGASARAQASKAVRSMVERIVAEGTALSGVAKQTLAFPGVLTALGEILACLSGEESHEKVVERLTGNGTEAEAMRSRMTALLGDWQILASDASAITDAFLASFLPKEGEDPDTVVHHALLALTSDVEVGVVARELHGLLSVPARIGRFRKMLAGDSGIPNVAWAMEKDCWDREALMELAKEPTEVGIRAKASFCYTTAFDEVFTELWRSRESFAAMEEFIARMGELPADAEGTARRTAFAMIAKEDSAMGYFAARLTTVMENALIRECFMKLGACAPEDVQHWLDELAVQQQATVRAFLAACDYHCVAGALTEKAAELRCHDERKRRQVITEIALLNL